MRATTWKMTPEERIDEFKEGLIQALIEDFADNTASYELMLTYLRQGE
jgi:hypothetical protein